MTGLPRALAPWAEQLALFPRHLALALAPLLPRLAGILGGGRTPGEVGEPDGFDGITRRGPYERLLASEWLLLSEVPDEFLRRVTAGEHSFLRTAHRPPPAGRDIVALLDVGPDQLGAPRVAHLAALVVLAARAERERGTLTWGFLQDERGSLHTGFTVASARALLDSGSPRAVTRDEVERRLRAPDVANASERWLVGGEDLRPEGAHRSASALVVTEPVEVDARHLDVSAFAAGAARARTVRLDPPGERTMVRLLRDPFEVAVTPRVRLPASVDAEAGLVIALDGHRLYLRSLEGELITVIIPTSPRMPVPPPATFTPAVGQTAIAVNHDRENRRTVLVCAGKDRYFRYQLSRSGRKTSNATTEHPGSEAVPHPADPCAGGLRELWYGGWHGAYFVDAEGRVVVVGVGATLLPKGIGERPPWEARAKAPLPFPAIPDSRRVADVLRDEVSGVVTHAVLLDPSRTRLDLCTAAWNKLLRQTTSPIRHVAVQEEHKLIAYLTEAAELGVYSVKAGAMVMTTTAGEGP